MKGSIKYIMTVFFGVLATVILMGQASTDAEDMVIAEIKSMFVEEATLVPKVDQFIILMDQSGSMYLKDHGQEEAKAREAKRIVYALNERIPELGYTGAIQVFTPDKTIIGPREYDRSMFRETINNLPEEGRIFGNRTPLGDAILRLDRVVDLSEGETAVIIVSDGVGNMGKDALKAAEKMHEKYTGTSFYTISLADEEQGMTTLKGISSLSDGMYVDGRSLTGDQTAVDKFAGAVFYDVELQETEAVAMMEEAAAFETITLETVYFAFDSFDLKPEGKMALDRSIELLKNRPELTVVIQGYTDQIGTPQYNRKLSEWRADAVYSYFLSKGISAYRLHTIGYGETRLLTTDMSQEGRRLNRRAEIPLVCNEKVQLAYCIVWPGSPAS